jgi:hypothetical protein
MAMDDTGAVGVVDVGTGDTGGDTGDTGDTGADTGATGDLGDTGGDTGDTGAEEFELDTDGSQKLDEQGNPIKKAPATTKSSFKDNYEKIKAADPQAADAYRKAHFGYQKYQEIFPTTADATAAKEMIETYGGAEGIETISAQAQQFGNEMDQFSKGDPKLLEMLAKEDPAGFSKSMTNGITLLGKTDPAAYSAALAPIMHSSLESSGINSALVEAGNTISDVFASLKASGADQNLLFALNKAFDGLKKAYGYSENIKKLSEQSAERPLTDKEKDIQARDQAVTKKEQDSYYGAVQKSVTTTLDSSINKALSVYYKQFPKITKDQKADVHSGVFSHISQQLSSNVKYQKQLRALLNEKDINKVNNFVAQNVSKIVQASAKAVWNRRGFGTLPNQQNNAGNQNTQVVLNRKPKREDIDFSLQGAEMEYMAGRATLKGSKRKVSWDWNKV